MKILFLSWENFGTAAMVRAFKTLGHEVCMLETSQEELLGDGIVARLDASLRDNTPDIIFGFNYFPSVARASAAAGIDYYSWVYDNPCVQLYSCTTILPTNHIYVFDSDTWLAFRSQGIENIRFLPMAADVVPDEGHLATARFHNDITFIGSLYNEKHDFYSRMMAKGLPVYTEGYLRGIMEAQKLLYGVNITENMLTDSVIENMYASLPLTPGSDSVITKRTLFAEYVVNRQITAEERRDMLTLLGTRFGGVSLYTADPTVRIPGCVNRGTADPVKETPAIYAASRINLNISLRSIVNGIPLRCFEIMGAGGFLLSSYAGDFAELSFTDGTDYVSFGSTAELVDKCEYYLSHEEERAAIAANGFARVSSAHTYVHRAKEMLDT